ncbi:MAG: glycosyltransferase family 25 protein [Planctomycetota bacterium]
MEPEVLAKLLREHFDHAYVINLPERTDRRREVSQQLARVGLAFDDGFVKRFDACKVDELAGFSSLGHRGCFTSHRDVLRHASAAGYERVWVLEDDCDFSRSFAEDVGPVLSALAATNWSHVRLGHYEHPTGGPGIQRIEPGRNLIATHCIAWRGKPVLDAAADFLDLLMSRPPGHPDGGPMPIDGAFNTLIAQRPDLEAFMAVPTLGIQRSSRSDITVSRWFDKVPVLRDLAGTARSLLKR